MLDITLNTHDLSRNWRNFTIMLTIMTEWLQSNYYRNSSGTSKVFDQGKLSEMFPSNCDTDRQPEITM